MHNHLKRTLLACVMSALVSTSCHASTDTAPEPSSPIVRLDDAAAPIAALSAEALNSLPSDGRSFEFVAGDTLKSALARWCHSAGWTLVWRVDVDYPIRSAGTLAGPVSFESAVEQTVRAYWLQSADLKASLYLRNRHLVISGLTNRRR